MNNVATLLLSATIGLLSGIGHGVTSHNLDLPFSLVEQAIPSADINHSWHE